MMLYLFNKDILASNNISQISDKSYTLMFKLKTYLSIAMCYETLTGFMTKLGINLLSQSPKEFN